MKRRTKVQTTEGANSLAHFELTQPAAHCVCVAGSFNDWNPEDLPLSARGDGVWRKDVTLQPGRYEYRFVVDGQWADDPSAKETVSNPFGGSNAVLQVQHEDIRQTV